MVKKMKRIYYFIIKTFICLILFLCLGIFVKSNSSYQDYIREKIYSDSISFSYFKDIYNHYLGGIFPIENIKNMDTVSVFNEKLQYSSVSDYENGAILEVDKNYLIPNLEKGIVVYIGEKEKYGNVVMVENESGVDIWYGNVCNTMVSLYDNLDSDSYLGESCDNYIYLVYSKKNDYLDYHDYLS